MKNESKLNKNKSQNVWKCSRTLWVVLFLCLLLLSGCEGSDKAVSFNLDIEDVTSETDTMEVKNTEAVDDRVGTTIMVHVCGAVKNPAVVELPADSRAEDALAAAGGLREDAHPDYVNLAAKLQDEQQLFFPTKEEAEVLLKEQSATIAGLININTAGEEQLSTLPGIGASRARDIIAYREANGAFQCKEDIMKVSGIKQSMYEKLCEQITIE